MLFRKQCMRRKIVFILSVVLVGFILGTHSENGEKHYDKNNIILKALGSVSIENIYKTVEELQNFETRYSWEKQEEVANYVFKKFQEYGIPVEFDEYYFRDKKWKNVVATIHGKRKPEDIYMVIAHFDSISKQPGIGAPGADDNASGTASVFRWTHDAKNVDRRGAGPMDASILGLPADAVRAIRAHSRKPA